MKVVYLHKVNNIPIYIGSGDLERAYRKGITCRTQQWRELTNNGYDVDVEIIAECNTKDEALQIENALIKELGMQHLGTGTLINKRFRGYKQPEEVKRKVSNTLKGHIQSEKSIKLKSEYSKRCNWYNDGINEYFKPFQPEGTIKGRIK